MDFTTFLILYILVKERQIIWNTVTFLITSSVVDLLWTPFELLWVGFLLFDVWCTRLLSPHFSDNFLSIIKLTKVAQTSKNPITLIILAHNGYKAENLEEKPRTNQ